MIRLCITDKGSFDECKIYPTFTGAKFEVLNCTPNTKQAAATKRCDAQYVKSIRDYLFNGPS